MKKRGIKTRSIILIIVGAIVLLVILIIAANVFVWMWSAKFLDNGSSSNPCTNIKLRIKETSAESNSITITRLAGGADVLVIDFRIIVNGNSANIISPEDKSLKELDTKTYTVDYDLKSGETVKAAPVVETGENRQMVCDIVDETRAA